MLELNKLICKNNMIIYQIDFFHQLNFIFFNFRKSRKIFTNEILWILFSKKLKSLYLKESHLPNVYTYLQYC
jgi:hypothetical protein